RVPVCTSPSVFRARQRQSELAAIGHSQDAQQLFERGQPLFYGHAAMLKQRGHSRLTSAGPNHLSACSAGDGLPQRVVDDEHFKNGYATIKTVVAAIAAGGLPARKRPGPQRAG